MAFSIALTLAQRDNLLTLQSVERNQATTQDRLSSGREVNDVTDDVFRYFAARSLDNRAQHFQDYKDGIDLAVSTLASTVDTLDTLTKLFEQLKGVIQSGGGKDQTYLTRLNTTLTPTLQEVGSVIIDAHFQGVNLLTGNGNAGNIVGALSVRFSEKHVLAIDSNDIFTGQSPTPTAGEQESVLVGTDYRSNDRFLTYTPGVTAAVVTLSNLLRFGTEAISSLEKSSGRTSILSVIVENISGVVRNLNTKAQQLGTYIGLLQIRSDFSRGYSTEHVKGTDKYTLADVNQEGAHLVALQTRQQLSLNSLAVSGRQQNAVLTLFS